MNQSSYSEFRRRSISYVQPSSKMLSMSMSSEKLYIYQLESRLNTLQKIHSIKYKYSLLTSSNQTSKATPIAFSHSYLIQNKKDLLYSPLNPSIIPKIIYEDGGEEYNNEYIVLSYSITLKCFTPDKKESSQKKFNPLFLSARMPSKKGTKYTIVPYKITYQVSKKETKNINLYSKISTVKKSKNMYSQAKCYKGFFVVETRPKTEINIYEEIKPTRMLSSKYKLMLIERLMDARDIIRRNYIKANNLNSIKNAFTLLYQFLTS